MPILHPTHLAIDFSVLSVALALIAFTLAGWGRLTLRLVGIPNARLIDCGTLWVGFTAVTAVVELAQLFIRIDWIASLIAVVVGLSVCLFDKQFSIVQSLKHLVGFFKTYQFGFICLVLLLVVWCLRAMGAPNNVDSGLYHFQSIRWLNEYPLLMGLANIHWRFAFNQSYFGFLALLNFYPFWGKGYATGGLFLLILSLSTVIEVGIRQALLWRWIVGGVLFIYFGYVAGTIANPAPDMAIGLVEIAMSLLLMRLAFATKISSQTDRDFATIALLAFTAVAIKLSGVAFAAACVMCALVFIRGRLSVKSISLIKVALLLAVATLVHSIRSYALSGTIMFPSTVFGLWQKEWTLQLAQIRFETDLILSLARQPDVMDPAGVLGNWHWLSGWMHRLPNHIAILFSASLLAMLFSLARVIKSKNSTDTKTLLLLYLPLLCSLIFWFLTAPDLRFLGAVLPIFIATALWLAVKQTQLRLSTLGHSNFEKWSILQALGVVLVLMVSFKLTGVRAISLEGWQAVPQVNAELKRTDSGFYIFVPGGGGFCWDHPLPCTPVFHPNLRFKDASWTIFDAEFGLYRKYFTTKTNPDPTGNQIYRFPLQDNPSTAPAQLSHP